jgi:hypothetical protein
MGPKARRAASARKRFRKELLTRCCAYELVDSTLGGNHACRHTYRSRSIWNVAYYYGIRSNPGVVPYPDRPQYFSARTNVYMATDFRYATVVGTNGYLLEQQAIWPDFSFRMYDDAVRMRQQQTASQLAIEGNVSASYYAPTSVSQYRAKPRQ